MKRIRKSSFWYGDKYSCASCGKKIGYFDKYCGNCGTSIEWEQCPHCGNVSENMKGMFCRDCGVAPINWERRHKGVK